MAGTFPDIIAFAILCTFLLLGTILRTSVPFLKRNLVPSSIIGGLVGFAALVFLSRYIGWSYNFNTLTFHFFTLSFMSLCLTMQPDHHEGSTKTVISGGLWLALIWVASLVLQSLMGFGAIYAFNIFSIEAVNEYLGALSTHGFTQGPGQALAIGTIWQDEFNVDRAADIGIIYASLGFVAAFLIGVPCARWAVARGLNANKDAAITLDFERGVYPEVDRPASGQQVTQPSNVDSLAYHISLLGVAYLLTHLWLVSMQGAVTDVAPFGIRLDILFSHNLFFVHGLIVCILLRMIIQKMGFARYFDADTQKRITSSSVDFMIIGTLMGIKVAVLAAYLAPVIVVAISISMITAIFCYFMGRQLAVFGLERSLTIFGCCTGSTGSGLLLLRIVDPDFRTTVSRELAFFNVAIVFLSIHVWAIVSPSLPSYEISTFLAIYGGTFAVCLLLLWLLQKRLSYVQEER
ncbi:sodium/glutamate symporter [Kordiimonas sp. SCSIO 12610]|uniref:sodium/glutamate symporter n=1 Tax=Kordiimonas sp. SCSIO 12610 TaxID=2829597 RepID=UPI00210E63CD|nr:sodium/glutamate symporter [Kordiimonas sp. SCSIO 12610]UTW54636.1 hypothetical protein KFF44_12600 [Kordiimonas sp. SCSIO 12610]